MAHLPEWAVSDLLLPYGHPITVDFASRIHCLEPLEPNHLHLWSSKASPATDPPSKAMFIEYHNRSYHIDLTLSLTSDTFVSVYDVIKAIHQKLRERVLQGVRVNPEAHAAYRRRLARILGPRERARDAAVGMRNVDRLGGYHHFKGLYPWPIKSRERTFGMWMHIEPGTPIEIIARKEAAHTARVLARFNTLYK